MKDMYEAAIERHWTEGWAKLGGMAMKFVSPGLRGVPDRINVHAEFPTFFIEMKKPGEEPTKQQAYVHALLKHRNVTVYTVDSIAAADALLEAFAEKLKH